MITWSGAPAPLQWEGGTTSFHGAHLKGRIKMVRSSPTRIQHPDKKQVVRDLANWIEEDMNEMNHHQAAKGCD